MIRLATASDAAIIAQIYAHYVEHSHATFEETPPSTADMAQRLEEANVAGLPFLVAQTDSSLAGYAYASPWKGRCAYRYSAEVTVYLDPGLTAQGWGGRLYQALFGQLQSLGMHAALAGISLPNEASIALHEKFGMKKVAHFQEVGYKFNRWIDVGYWQVIFEPSPTPAQSH